MSEKKTVTPFEKKRVQVYQSMPKELQAVADELERKIGKVSVGLVVASWDVGKMIHGVMEQEATYGSKAVEQLAAYMGQTATALYALKDFHLSFDRDYVKEWTEKPMTNGGHLSEKHWMCIRQLADKKAQEKFLKRTLEESMSANDLAKEVMASGSVKKNVRSGGRKASAPTSPLAGLQKFGALALSLSNYESQQMESSVFTAIDEMAPDSVNEILLERLEKTQEVTSAAKDRLETAAERLEANIDRVKEIMEEKAEKEAEAKEAEEESKAEAPAEEEEKPKKKKDKKAKKGGEPESNGDGAKAKKKSKKPVAAV